MLQRIIINNIALIDKIDVEFRYGLNILTGETGAGKSIVIDSINAVLGSRISKDLIRSGQDSAKVEGFFEVTNTNINNFLKENELYQDDILTISREFNTSGKNICRINGNLVNVSILKQLGELLVDIHGQHDNQSLLNTASHIELLDSFGGQNVYVAKQRYTDSYNKVKECKKKISELGGDSRERERRVDLLNFQLQEISAANLKAGEDEALESQRVIMNNSEKMIGSIEESYDILYGGNKNRSIIDGLNIVIRELNNILKYDERVSSYIEKINSVYYGVEDIIDEIRKYKEEFEFDPNLLDTIEERLDTISRLKRKYGVTIEEIISYQEELNTELEQLNNSQELLEKYSLELEELTKQMTQHAKELSSIRRTVANKLEKQIVEQLEDLEMKRTSFKVDFIETECGPNGADKIEFLISPNAGESLKPLSKIASGGEMSRIMLAIKTILAEIDYIPTLIFDEIDNGISGKAAQMVGQKLSHIAKNHQVLCITHLPQIAIMADSHYLIEKHIQGNLTRTDIQMLNLEQQQNEIARILGGTNITETTLKHAQEMLQMAEQRKNA